MGRNHRDYRRLFLTQILSRENAGMNFVCIQNQTFACGNRAVHIFPFLKLLRLLLGNLHALFGHLIMKRLLKNGKQRLFLRTQP